jgi:hypothetical protein
MTRDAERSAERTAQQTNNAVMLISVRSFICS